jgi:hypothetical protein
MKSKKNNLVGSGRTKSSFFKLLNKKNKASATKIPKILKESKFSPLAIEVIKKLKAIWLSRIPCWWLCP